MKRQGIRWTAAFLAAVTFSLLFSGCSLSLDLSFGSGTHSRPQGSGLFGNSSYWEPSEEDPLDDTSYLDALERQFTDYPTAVRHTLDEDEEELYKRIIARIENEQYTFTFENISNDTFKKAYYAVLYDHPEYFWMGHNYSYQVQTNGEGDTRLKVEPSLFSEDEAAIRQAKQALESAVQVIVSGAERQDDLYQKVKYVHDYIIDHTTYDSGALETITNGVADGAIRAANAYGCLVEHQAVCSGYAAAFQLLMQRLDIECGCVNGMRSGDVNAHQWNYVCLDGDYYYMDVTWDDPVREDGTQTRTYEYFLLSEEDLAYTHVKNDDLPAPVCSGIRYNFYRYNGLYFDEYDFGAIRLAADVMAGDSALTMKFSSPAACQEAEDDLIEHQRIFDIDYIDGHITYSRSSSGCILTINY